MAFGSTGAFGADEGRPLHPQRLAQGGRPCRAPEKKRSRRSAVRLTAVGAAAALAIAATVASRPSDNTASALMKSWQVQHPLDKSVDVLLLPIWRTLEPLVNFGSYLLMSPVRLHLRLEALRASRDTTNGAARAAEAIKAATAKVCSVFQHVFDGSAAHRECPEVLVLAGSRPRLATFVLGRGRKQLLVATEGLAHVLEEEVQLRFVIGRELGKSIVLHHGAPYARWAMAHAAKDFTAVPRYFAHLMSRAAGALGMGLLRLSDQLPEGSAKAAPRSSADDEFLDLPPDDHSYEAQRQMQLLFTGLSEACEMWRGPLQAGRWPGLEGLDLNDALSRFGGPARGPTTEATAALLTGFGLGRAAGGGSLGAIDVAADICARLRRPDGKQALTAAALGIAAPIVVAKAFDLDAGEEQLLRTTARLMAWAAGIWARKIRSEELSADRLGFVAAGGDTSASIRAMVRFSQDGGESAAMAALLGEKQLVRQAEFLSQALPRAPFDPSPGLPARVADLAGWARSKEGQVVARTVRNV
eukprot:TRINITY_DN64899_c0_g1_i1.p1 TRINITY_DN64899_c0_g1~~TRINITY_DN64899_c0_g1_i1.p1  ORF type:complete len:529 (-),score=97.68 TRINITY_DN64899_c0_g1_i1:14-1600(-)